MKRLGLFQSLLGSLKTGSVHGLVSGPAGLFQSLLGSLKTLERKKGEKK